MKRYNVAVLGASGVVGQCILKLLESSNFPIANLYPLASMRSKGESITFRNEMLPIEAVSCFDFQKVDIGFFSAGASVSADYAPIAAKAGCVVIDNTACFRMDPAIPLVIPEVNAQALKDYKNRNIIANPNCSTIQMLVALKPIYDAVGITRINVATYQSVSGTGREAIALLHKQSEAVLQERSRAQEKALLQGAPVYPVPIAFNLFPHIDSFEANGYTKEEMKMLNETRKILKDPTILVNATAVRVPVFYGHAEAIHLETRHKITAEELRDLLSKAPGVIVKDNFDNRRYPTPYEDAQGSDAVWVGRIREDISHPLGVNLWVVADNIRKGAALNSVQLAQKLISDYL